MKEIRFINNTRIDFFADFCVWRGLCHFLKIKSITVKDALLSKFLQNKASIETFEKALPKSLISKDNLKALEFDRDTSKLPDKDFVERMFLVLLA